jgi:hypothetical protein
MFTPGFMGSRADVTSPIPRFVPLEVIEAPSPAVRQRSNVAMVRIKAVVDVAIEAVRAVKPGAGSEEEAANKPIGPIITVRSTVIGGIVEVPIRAHRSWPDVYADGNLGWRRWRTA